MKKEILFSLILILNSAVLIGQKEANWKPDITHSNFGFKVLHKGVSFTVGEFREFDLDISSNGPGFLNAQIELSVDAASINTANDSRDNHLRSADFFDTEKHPKITFKSKKIKGGSNGDTNEGGLIEKCQDFDDNQSVFIKSLFGIESIPYVGPFAYPVMLILNILIFFTILFTLMMMSCTISNESVINGAWQYVSGNYKSDDSTTNITSDDVKSIKIYSNNHYSLITQFISSDNFFAHSGLFNLDGESYTESFKIHKNTEKIGKSETFRYELNNNQLIISNEFMSSISKSAMVERVQKFIPAVKPENFPKRGTSGIRTPVISPEGEFVSEMKEVEGKNSFHIVNYNSPGATGAPAYSAFVVKQLQEKGILPQPKEQKNSIWNFEDI